MFLKQSTKIIYVLILMHKIKTTNIWNTLRDCNNLSDKLMLTKTNAVKKLLFASMQYVCSVRIFSPVSHKGCKHTTNNSPAHVHVQALQLFLLLLYNSCINKTFFNAIQLIFLTLRFLLYRVNQTTRIIFIVDTRVIHPHLTIISNFKDLNKTRRIV